MHIKHRGRTYRCGSSKSGNAFIGRPGKMVKMLEYRVWAEDETGSRRVVVLHYPYPAPDLDNDERREYILSLAGKSLDDGLVELSLRAKPKPAKKTAKNEDKPAPKGSAE